MKGGSLQNAICMVPRGNHPPNPRRRGQGRELTDHPLCSQLEVHKLKINRISSLWTCAFELMFPNALQILTPHCKTDTSTFDGLRAFNGSVI